MVRPAIAPSWLWPSERAHSIGRTRAGIVWPRAEQSTLAGLGRRRRRVTMRHGSAANMVEIAALVGDTARAMMLAALMGGEALTAQRARRPGARVARDRQRPPEQARRARGYSPSRGSGATAITASRRRWSRKCWKASRRWRRWRRRRATSRVRHRTTRCVCPHLLRPSSRPARRGDRGCARRQSIRRAQRRRRRAD